MSLIADVGELLARAGIRHVLIGAAALAVHGVARATADLDLLVVDPGVLESSLWDPLRSGGVEVVVRRGDDDDPLLGVVRVGSKDEGAVDVIVGRGAWQGELLARASSTRVADADLPVVEAADLILLKLYAGGPQDAWDIAQLLDVDASLASAVETRLSGLPEGCESLWRRILGDR
ncbi:MAG: hypothetical protein QNK04_18020 [Myxococcota bacterium]|nr:hypothetical protein [Myxococcota bacterium]